MKFELNMGMPNILTVAFVVLKLCHVINWSWWFVVSPTILFCLFPFLILGLIFGTLALIEFWESLFFKRKKYTK